MTVQIMDIMALPCHDQSSAPFVTWKFLGSLLQSGVRDGPPEEAFGPQSASNRLGALLA